MALASSGTCHKAFEAGPFLGCPPWGSSWAYQEDLSHVLSFCLFCSDLILAVSNEYSISPENPGTVQ